MVPDVGVDHAPITVFATEAYTPTMTPSPGLPISVPVSGSIPVPEQLSAGDRELELETPPTVSVHAVLTIVIANYWSFSTCLWPPIVHFHPRCPMP
jgi:hypothetical protein